MFETSRRVEFLDRLRIPYRVAGPTPHEATDGPRLEVIRSADGGTLVFPSWPDGANDRGTAFHLLDAPLFGRLCGDELAVLAESVVPGPLKPSRTIVDASGEARASIWTGPDGSTVLPFDPDEVILTLLSERYQAFGAPPVLRLGRVGKRLYYAARPVLGSYVRLGVRKILARMQRRSTFPRWPAETVLHDLQDLLLRTLAGIAGTQVPYIAAWPAGYTWALVLSHDVETSSGYAAMQVLLDVETEAGYRSSWNFVPKRYEVIDADVRALQANGFEVGVHGLYHDGYDLGSLETLRARLPEIRSYAERWGAVGFRSPSTHRRWSWMPLLGLDYDMSYSDTAPFEPQPGGCCSWLPFFIDDLVEIPITLPQDHTLFRVLGARDASAWCEKTDLLRERGGMANMLTHPDYMSQPAALDAYRHYLAKYQHDATAWKALPRDVSDWWRRRAASRLERVDGEWRIVGPAASDGQISVAGADTVLASR